MWQCKAADSKYPACDSMRVLTVSYMWQNEGVYSVLIVTVWGCWWCPTSDSMRGLTVSYMWQYEGADSTLHVTVGGCWRCPTCDSMRVLTVPYMWQYEGVDGVLHVTVRGCWQYPRCDSMRVLMVYYMWQYEGADSTLHVTVGMCWQCPTCPSCTAGCSAWWPWSWDPPAAECLQHHSSAHRRVPFQHSAPPWRAGPWCAAGTAPYPPDGRNGNQHCNNQSQTANLVVRGLQKFIKSF